MVTNKAFYSAGEHVPGLRRAPPDFCFRLAVPRLRHFPIRGNLHAPLRGPALRDFHIPGAAFGHPRQAMACLGGLGSACVSSSHTPRV
jgi:hypothetical protein